jgi:nitroreductase
VCKNFGTEGLNTASCAIAVIADGQKSDVWIEDASAAAILMQVEAESLGVGSVWIQIRNRQSGPESSEEEVRKVLHIPEKYCVLCVLAMGYKDEDKEPYEEENLDFSKIHNGRY